MAPDLPRALLPLETYPVSAGIKGGLAGSVAMAVLACMYGILKQGSIWYPINLLAATVYTQSRILSEPHLRHFIWTVFLLATAHSSVHVTAGRTSLRCHAAHDSASPHSSGRDRRRRFSGRDCCTAFWSCSIHC